MSEYTTAVMAVAELVMTAEHCLTDVRYAMRQLTHNDPERAMDALERVVERLEAVCQAAR